jgi:hypothetical protein
MTKQQATSPDDETEMGPAMRALVPKQRLFVLAMLSDPGGFQGSWAEAAGYSTKGDSHHVVACRLMQDPRIIAASQEVARQHLGGNGPVLAARNLINIAKNEKHPKHYEASLAILNRTGMSEKTEHTVRVEHATDDRSMLELCRRMAAEMGIPLEMLIGANTIDGETRAPKLIEAEAVEAEPAPELDDPFAAQAEKTEINSGGKSGGLG